MAEDLPVPVASEDPLVGRTLDGRFRIVRRIATGGMGRVYLGEQAGLDRVVAIKVLSMDVEHADNRWQERFFREARLCSRLTHPNTVRIFESGRTKDDVFYIAMEYVEGRTLTKVLRSDGLLEPLRAISFARQVCGSLAEAHAANLVHRDLKPDNLMVTRLADGREHVKVLDFGIAKDVLSAADLPTEAGVIFGSPGYMSPEQILERELTPRSDIYSLGAVLFRMLTGSGPFGSANPVQALTRHVTTQPLSFSAANPEVALPPLLEWVTVQCLAKNPDHRFATVAEVDRALRVCELVLRGAVAAPPRPELRDGAMALPAEIVEYLRRFDGDAATPAPGAARRAETPEPDSMAVDPTWVSSVGRGLSTPAVLVLGSLVPLFAAGLLFLVLAVAVASVVVASINAGSSAGSSTPDPTEAVAEPAQQVQPAPAPDVAPAPPEAAGAPVPQVAEPRPVRRGVPRPSPVAQPAPEPSPQPVVVPDAAPAPQPAEPVPEDDPTRRPDLRDPFED